MAEVSRSCGACGGTLGADDLYCPRCGTPTARKADPEATLVNPASRLSTPASPGADPEATVVNPASAPGKQPQRVSVSGFNDRLREVLGAEYELLSVLGQGGFGRVYRARDRRLDRFVAIKVIRPDLMGSNEFVDSFLSELADALAAAHRSKMMHLDIKPANVFLEGELQKVLLMDFGLAKALTDQVDESAAVPVVGTPEYMSPEQARGQPDIDYRSDIYSMGVIGYRMLMGRPPFRGRDSADTLAKHINEAPVPLRELNPTIPKGLADAIMRCLAKDPWDRFPNALDLRGALEAVTFFSGSGSMAAPEDEPRMQRTLLLLIAATALLAGLVIGRMLG